MIIEDYMGNVYTIYCDNAKYGSGGLRTLSKEHKRKLSIAHKGKKLSKIHKIKISLALKSKGLSEEHRKKLSVSCKASAARYWLGKKRSKALGKILSRKMKQLWQNEEWRERTGRAILKGLCKRPTSLEEQFIELIKKYDLPFRYVGDGSLIIGGRCPDFVENNGRKMVVEVRHSAVCKYRSKITPKEYAKKRIKHFDKFGWKCLVFFENDLNDEGEIVKSLSNRANRAM